MLIVKVNLVQGTWDLALAAPFCAQDDWMVRFDVILRQENISFHAGWNDGLLEMLICGFFFLFLFLRCLLASGHLDMKQKRDGVSAFGEVEMSEL